MTTSGRNYVEQVYEPVLPLSRSNGMLARCTERWENIPAIQLKTDPDWWGNSISDQQIGGLFAVNEDDPILADGEYLKKLAAYAEADLSVLKSEEIADKYTVVVTNPEMDNIMVEVAIMPVDPKLSVVPYREYNKPEVVKFWLSTLGGVPLTENTLGDSTLIQSNLGGISQ